MIGQWIRDRYRTCRDFVHRGRYGYAKRDVASSHLFIAKLMSYVLTEYIEQITSSEWAGYPTVLEGKDNPFETWVAIVTEMRDGFGDYVTWEEGGWEEPAKDDTETPVSEWIDAYRVRQEQVDAKLRRSLDLMQKWFPSLWW